MKTAAAKPRVVTAPKTPTPERYRTPGERIAWGVFAALFAQTAVGCGVDFTNDFIAMRQGSDVLPDPKHIAGALVGPYWSWCCATRAGLVSAVAGRARKVMGAPLGD